MISVVIISLAYFVSMLIVYLVYFIGKSKPNVKIEVSGSLDIGPTLAGYMLDNSENNFRLIFVNILELVKKGYIKMETKSDEYIFIKNVDDVNNLKNYEIMAFNFLFDRKDKVSLTELIQMVNSKDAIKVESKISTLYAHKESVQNELEMQEYIVNKDDKLKAIHQLYFILGAVFIALSAIFVNLLFIITFVVWTIFTGVFFSYISNDIKYTQKGVNERERALKYRNYIKKTIINSDNIQKIELLDDIYLYAIAFGLDITKTPNISYELVHELKEKNSMKKVIYSNDLYTVYFVKIAIAFSLTLLVIIMLNLVSMVMKLY